MIPMQYNPVVNTTEKTGFTDIPDHFEDKINR
jgi:hypothetical protein